MDEHGKLTGNELEYIGALESGEPVRLNAIYTKIKKDQEKLHEPSLDVIRKGLYDDKLIEAIESAWRVTERGKHRRAQQLGLPYKKDSF